MRGVWQGGAKVAMSESTQTAHLPWEPQSHIRGGLAVGNLYQNVCARLKDARGLHAQNALATFGYIAGAATQNAAWAEMRALNRPLSEMIVANTTSGESYYFGDRLNSYLLPQKGFDRLTLWALLGGAAV